MSKAKSYTKSDFLSDVAKEARALKKYATKKEIEQLNIKMLDPTSQYSCVYGQMTGACHTLRAMNLIQKCCPRFFVNHIVSDAPFSNIKKCVNGTNITVKKDRSDWSIGHFSALEAYIITKSAKNANLIAFLKGERKDLVL